MNEIKPNIIVPPMSVPSLAGITLSSTAKIISPQTKLAMLLWASPGAGKTVLAASLNRLTEMFEKKPSLIIAVEASEGGGAASINRLNMPLYQPKDVNDLMKCLSALRNDKGIGGVILDSATETVKQHVKPAALKYPPKENFATRTIGVPTRSDYQVMGELTSSIFRQLLLLTTHENPEYRKHVIITATDKERDEDERIVWKGPDLPGRMASEAAAMFQIVGTIAIKREVVTGKSSTARYLCTTTDGVSALKDRFNVFPPEVRLKNPNLPDDKSGMDLADMWEQYWLPKMKGE